MTTTLQSNYRTRRVYEVRPLEGGRELRLSDRVVELGEREFGWYQSVATWLPSVQGVAELSRDLGLDEARVPRLFETLEDSGLLYRVDAGAKSMCPTHVGSCCGQRFSSPARQNSQRRHAERCQPTPTR